MKRQPTIVDVTWFLDLDRMGQLNLDPPYQRKSVWTLKDRRYFIDTIFRDYPCPPVFLHKDLSDDGYATYNVVDGKQRLQTILSFVNNDFSLSKDFGDTNLNGKLWQDISIEYKKKFWNYSILIDYINDISDTSTVNEVFDRVNRNQKRLEPQELRHAKYSGWLITEAETESSNAIWKKYGVSTTARARRMKDVQFISELMLVVIEEEIKGFDQDALDSKYAEYDDPSDTNIEFSKEDYHEKIYKINEILEELERTNGAVTKYAKNLNNFYTLWSFVTLNIEKLGDIKKVSNEYVDFMEIVKVASKDTTATSDQNVLDYITGSSGASTDLRQRTMRLKALEKALLH